MPILNYTTSVDSAKTVGEITHILVKHGARKIVIDYDQNGQATSVTFHIEVMGRPIYYALPCNHVGVLTVMKKDKKVGPKFCTTEQAIRVAWRIVKDWVEAQLAIIEAGLVTLPEVMLPYAVTSNGETLYKRIEQDRTLLLNP